MVLCSTSATRWCCPPCLCQEPGAKAWHLCLAAFFPELWLRSALVGEGIREGSVFQVWEPLPSTAHKLLTQQDL